MYKTHTHTHNKRTQTGLHLPTTWASCLGYLSLGISQVTDGHTLRLYVDISWNKYKSCSTWTKHRAVLSNNRQRFDGYYCFNFDVGSAKFMSDN